MFFICINDSFNCYTYGLYINNTNKKIYVSYHWNTCGTLPLLETVFNDNIWIARYAPILFTLTTDLLSKYQQFMCRLRCWEGSLHTENKNHKIYKHFKTTRHSSPYSLQTLPPLAMKPESAEFQYSFVYF